MRKPGFILGLILLGALLLRVPGLGTENYWTDEYASLVSSSGHAVSAIWPAPGPATMQALRHTALQDAQPISAIPGGLRNDNHPPVYYVVLRVWREMFGDREVIVRSLSVLASLLSLLVFFDVVRILSTPTVALWATALLALAPLDVYFARDGRPDTLLILFLMIAASALARLEKFGSSRIWSAVLGLASFAAFLTHYYAAGFLAGLFVHAVLRLRGRARVEAIVAFVAAGLVAAVVWGPMMMAQTHVVAGNNDWNLDRPGGRLNLLVHVLCLPFTILFTARNTIAPRPAWLGVLWLVVAYGVWRRPNLRLFAWGAAGAIGLVVMVDFVRNSQQLDFPRYVLAAVPAACALLASVVTTPTRMRHGLVALVALSFALWLPKVYQPVRPAWRTYVSRIEQFVPHDRLLVLWRAREPAGASVMALSTYAPRDERRLFVLPLKPGAADVAPLTGEKDFFVLAVEDDDPKALLGDGNWECLLRWYNFPVLWHVTR